MVYWKLLTTACRPSRGVTVEVSDLPFGRPNPAISYFLRLPRSTSSGPMGSLSVKCGLRRIYRSHASTGYRFDPHCLDLTFLEQKPSRGKPPRQGLTPLTPVKRGKIRSRLSAPASTLGCPWPQRNRSQPHRAPCTATCMCQSD